MVNREVKQLNAVLGGISFKSIGDALFVPMLEALGALGDANTAIEKLEVEAAKQLGLDLVNGQLFGGDVDSKVKFIKVSEEIGSKEVEIKLPSLTMDQFKKLSEENEKLSGAALLLIKKHLVTGKQ